MRFFNVAAVLLASAGIAAAADCPAHVLDTCLKTTEPAVKKCPPNDYECLCTKNKAVLTCYDNCPDHEGRFGAQSTVTANCNAAKSYSGTSSSDADAEEADDVPTARSGSSSGSSSSSSSGKGKGSSGGDSGEEEEEEDEEDEEEEGTATGSGEAETSTGAASAMSVEAGGVVAAVFAGLSAVLL
ncbi:hypothetical protein FQN54_002098 [Arachnomyces sp. PD_36]|nr:hypothetical protein FQN54_002098 [Arachnomyces sp. PD_36]